MFSRIKEYFASRRARMVQMELQGELLQKLTNEIADAHHRITLRERRIAQMEHYLGLRHHKFTKRDDRWWFNQVRSDVLKRRKPTEKTTLKAA